MDGFNFKFKIKSVDHEVLTTRLLYSHFQILKCVPLTVNTHCQHIGSSNKREGIEKDNAMIKSENSTQYGICASMNERRKRNTTAAEGDTIFSERYN